MTYPFVNIHTHGADNDGIYIVVGDRISECAGMHPWDIKLGNDHTDQLACIVNTNIVAIGEIGLDYAYLPKSIDLYNQAKHAQKELFKQQIDIAQKLSLPIILHCVKAFEDTITLLRNRAMKAVVFHGFIGSIEQARIATNSGYYLSLNQASLRSPRTVAALKSTPLNKLFLETDTSSSSIAQIYNEVSILLDINTDQLKQIIYNNYKTIFE